MCSVFNFENKPQISRNGAGDRLTLKKDAIRRRSVDSDSDSNGSSLPHHQRLRTKNSKVPGRKCSSCSCHRPVSFTTIKKEANERDIRDLTPHHLEAKLCNIELDEGRCMEDLNKLQERFDRTTQHLEALMLYIQSLDLKVRSFTRLADLTENFVYKDLTPTETLPLALDRIMLDVNLPEQISEVQSLLAPSRNPEKIYQLWKDLRERRNRRHSAANSFSQYLRSCSKVSASKLSRYEGQYEAIRSDCERTRDTLEKEINQLVNTNDEYLAQGLSKLVSIRDKLKNRDIIFYSLCLEIAKCLRGPFKRQSSQNICVTKQL